MFNLNEKYFSISERCGRNHQNKFCLRPLKWTNVPGELNRRFKQISYKQTSFLKHTGIYEVPVRVESGTQASQINDIHRSWSINYGP